MNTNLNYSKRCQLSSSSEKRGNATNNEYKSKLLKKKKHQSPLNTRFYGNSSESLPSTSRIVVCSQPRNSWCSFAPFVIGNARRMRPQRCLCATLIPRRMWRHRRRSSGVREYSAVNSSASSCVDFDGFSEAALASRSVVMTVRLFRASCCGIFGSGCGASMAERMLRTVGSLGRTGLRPSVGGMTGGEVALDVVGLRAASPVTDFGDRSGLSSSLMTTK